MDQYCKMPIHSNVLTELTHKSYITRRVLPSKIDASYWFSLLILKFYWLIFKAETVRAWVLCQLISWPHLHD